MKVRTAWSREEVVICRHHYDNPPAWVPALGEVLDGRGHPCVPGCIGRSTVEVHVNPTGDADGWRAFWCGENNSAVFGIDRPAAVGGTYLGPSATALAENDGAALVAIARAAGRAVKCYLDGEAISRFKVRTYDAGRKAWV